STYDYFHAIGNGRRFTTTHRYISSISVLAECFGPKFRGGSWAGAIMVADGRVFSRPRAHQGSEDKLGPGAANASDDQPTPAHQGEPGASHSGDQYVGKTGPTDGVQ